MALCTTGRTISLIEAFYRAHFTDQISIFDHITLTELAVGADLGRDEVTRVLGSEAYGDAVSTDETMAWILVRRSSARPTGLAIVLVEPDRESTIIVDSGANGLLGPDDVPPTYASGVVLAQLGVPAATVGAALTSARVAGARSVLSTSPLVPGSERLVDMADIVACDRVEAMRWTVEAPKLCTAVQLSTSACRRPPWSGRPP